MWVGKIGYNWNHPCVDNAFEPIAEKFSPKIISLEPLDPPPPIWPPSSPHLAMSEKPSFHKYFSRSCSIIFLLANFHHICSRDQRFSRIILLSAAKTSRYLTDFQSKTPSEIQNPIEFQFFSKTLWNLILSPKPCWLAISLPKHDWVSLSSSFTSFPSFPPQFLSAYSSYSFLPPPSF